MSTGKILKVYGFGSSMESPEPLASKQLLEDPFSGSAAYGIALITPPYSFESLVYLAESHPTHSAALEQKVVDTIADGPVFIANTKGSATDKELLEVETWWKSLCDEYTPLELLSAVWSDQETLGWGMFEAVRDVTGVLRRIYHVPAQTVRAHRDGKLLAQIRMGKMVWFKRWGVEEDYYWESGTKLRAGADWTKKASELLVFRRPSRSSTWYGVPGYISAIGHIAMAIAARDYNVLFFENAREPRHLIVVTGLAEDVGGVVDDIAQQLTLQYKDPHRNILLPISGDANVRIEKMGFQQNDMHYAKLIDTAENSILLAHRVPPDRIGLSKRGFLGGNVASILNRIYRDGVVSPNQILLEDRLTRFLRAEYELATGKAVDFKVDFEALDISDEASKTDMVATSAKNDVIKLNEGRATLGLPYADEFGEMTQSEFRQLVKSNGTEALAHVTESQDATDSAFPSSSEDSVTTDDGEQVLTENVLEKHLAMLAAAIEEVRDQQSELLEESSSNSGIGGWTYG